MAIRSRKWLGFAIMEREFVSDPWGWEAESMGSKW